ncbi:eukaryotic translation initiation factor 3 subunit B [Gregarina niphandrodes]|uniref:Eukaryotic translation initiation factor 3 subunit B n=1 Tax=Gregarina niphandrodes TaxID=110365 RepID=A0A023B9D8_GRENI|nr:eukaryotic translation initiation factor 3 subunit B [Gregarina niphandrodes]EZG72776.1 eukaryotic translation initiation factor 3 subunit B [Gregarina niphandrodes]|eukprot:XP_011129748.1 eukaryotic translation initiation factor 3 subunit B [Gregarina niphandrodes]
MAAQDLVVLPLPDATADKVEKLAKVLTKRVKENVAKAGVRPDRVTVEVAVNGEGACRHFGAIDGLCDMEASIPYNFIQPVLDNVLSFKLDKKHEIYLASSKAIKNFDGNRVEEELEVLTAKKPGLNLNTYDKALRGDLWNWFQSSGDEMFVLRHKDETEILRLDSATMEPHLVNHGEAAAAERKALGAAIEGNLPAWTNRKAFWSPQGTFLVTTHTQGVRLWGGENFHSVARLRHKDVETGIFSRNEEYLATWDGVFGNDKVYVHSVVTCETIAKLATPKQNPDEPMQWPLLCWSHNSQYFAIACDDGIKVYHIANAMGPVVEVSYADPVAGKIPYYPAPGATFSWQPNSRVGDPAVLAVWTAKPREVAPSRLTLFEIPTFKVLATRNIFSIDGIARIYWSHHGEYCALVTQIQAKAVMGQKRAVHSQLDVFTMKAFRGSLPVSSVSIPHEIMTVSWSESRDRLGILSMNKEVIFYAVTKKGLEQCGAPLDVPREINTISWSPLGTHFVLSACSVEDSAGTLWFGVCSDVSNPTGSWQSGSGARLIPGVGLSGRGMAANSATRSIPGAPSGIKTAGGSSGTAKDVAGSSKLFTPEILFKGEQMKLQHVEWDPSGRYVSTSVSSPVGSKSGYKIDEIAGYTLWSCQGKAIYNASVEGLHRFQWRPHPFVHMPESVRESVKDSFGQYTKTFEAQDSKRKTERRELVMKCRRQQKDAFERLVAEARESCKALEGASEWEQMERDYQQSRNLVKHVQENLHEISVIVKPALIPTN